MGANNPVVVADEPGAWEVVGGEMMNDALDTALGKPDATMRVIYIGTVAPSQGGWWRDLVHTGSTGSTYVMALQADPERWDMASEIRRVNPLMWHYPDSRKVLLEERDAARHDTRLAARFRSYRLNLPTADESTALVAPDDWQRTLARPLAEPTGRPIVAIDLGGGRAFSAAVAIWKTGRVDAVAVAPGIPDVAAQERRDRVPRGLYERMIRDGVLTTSVGKRVQSADDLLDVALARWGDIEFIIGDRFRVPEVYDWNENHRIPIIPRVTRWSEASEDIRAVRRMTKDGPMSVVPSATLLLTASLSAAQVKGDDAGNMRLVKRGTNNTGRDDVAAALTLAAGAWERHRTWADDNAPVYSGMTRV